MPPAPRNCTYRQNMDWNQGAWARQVQVQGSTTEQLMGACCRACAASAGCKGATLAHTNECFLKTASDVAKGLMPSAIPCVACVQGPTEGASGGDARIEAGNLSIAASVPGDVVSDLFNAGVIADPLSGTVFRDNSSLWSQAAGSETGPTWTYEKRFDAAEFVGTASLLVFDGIKMGATVSLNGAVLGVATNQFVRYTFALNNTALLRTGNHLVVTFRHAISVQGRYMACSGGWDWAPVSNTLDADGLQDFTRGIWKSVYVVPVPQAAILHLVPHVQYGGGYPTEPLTEESKGPFTVDVELVVWCSSAQAGSVTVSGGWSPSSTVQKGVSLRPGENTVRLRTIASPEDYRLWWPNGMGPCSPTPGGTGCDPRPMYNVTASFTPSNGGRGPGGSAATVSASRRIGFRFVAFVTRNDTSPHPISDFPNGTSQFTMRFRVNGASMYARGANMIPMEALEGRASASGLQRVVQSAADANFNFLRIWGGGMFMYDAFYDACDAAGILLFHDMMYAQQGHSPHGSAAEAEELQHQVRRLTPHPCMAIFDGCNECDAKGSDEYVSFVMQRVANTTQSVAVWPSCPALGWEAGVDPMTTLPTGGPLLAKTDPHTAVNDSHGPYVTGNGWATDEAPFWHTETLVLFEPDTTAHIMSDSCKSPPTPGCQQDSPLQAVPTGPSVQGWFKSEFGCSAWSSFESVSPLIPPSEWGLHSNIMFEHNWPADNIIQSYWGPQNLNATGESAFKRQLYQSMVGQALFISAEVQGWRSSNLWGTFIWQFNEIWPTGGWGSVEYGGRRPGQVTGGRWKPLHYLLKRTAFADVLATCCLRCAPTANCFVKNDGFRPFAGVVNVSWIDLKSGAVTHKHSERVQIGTHDDSGAQTVHWFGLGAFPNASVTLLRVDVFHVSGGHATRLSQEDMLLAPPKHLVLLEANVTARVAEVAEDDGTVAIDLFSTAPAVGVVLTTLCQGRFSDNFVTVLPGAPTRLQFVPFEPPDVSLLRSSLRVEHVQQMQ